MPDEYFDMRSFDPLTVALASRIGWVCLHSVWQGFAVAGILSVILAGIPRKSTAHVNARYLVSVLAMATLPFLAILTFLYGETSYSAREFLAVSPRAVSPRADSPRADSRVTAIPEAAREPHASAAVSRDVKDGGRAAPWTASYVVLVSRIEPWLPTLSVLWSLGATLASVRLIVGWTLARSLAAQPFASADMVWRTQLDRLRDALKIVTPVRLLFSHSIDAPALLGWFRPVIVWPASLITGMAPAEINAILAHELAHVRRHDFLVNVFQSMIELLFFHHPAVWWISGQIRAEREHCADELAVRVLETNHLATRLTYAQALLMLEERRSTCALSVPARGGHLLSRIRRLSGIDDQRTSPAKMVAAVLSIVPLLGFALPSERVLNLSQARESQQFRIEREIKRGVKPAEPAPETMKVTEPIADAIVARLTARQVDAKKIEKLRDDMAKAIKAGKPLELPQVHELLEKLGIDKQTLHAPRNEMAPAEPAPETMKVTEPIADAIVARLTARQVDAKKVEKIRDDMAKAIQAGKPLELPQVHELLEKLGIDKQTLHGAGDAR